MFTSYCGAAARFEDMPTLTLATSPATGFIGGGTFTSGGGGGGVFGPGATSGGGSTGTFNAYVAPASGGSGPVNSVTGSVGQFVGSGGGGLESAFYDQRLAEIYYLGDKPWYDESRFDDPQFDKPLTMRPTGNLTTLAILAGILLLARNL